MALCEYCRLIRLKEEAEAAGKVVTIKQSFANGMGGYIVYVHPDDIKSIVEEDARHAIYVKGWFKEVPTKCSCII